MFILRIELESNCNLKWKKLSSMEFRLFLLLFRKQEKKEQVREMITQFLTTT